jgi:hypothetical protein
VLIERVDFVGGLPDTQFVIGRLLENQTDIGNAVKPYYGAKAGNELTVLLKSHINAAVALLEAAKSADASATAKAKAKAAFYANGNQVARFLHAANPNQWSLAAMQTMMRILPQPGRRACGRSARGELPRRDHPLQHVRRPSARHGRHAQRRNHPAVPRPVPLIGSVVRGPGASASQLAAVTAAGRQPGLTGTLTGRTRSERGPGRLELSAGFRLRLV